jgi:hypothetical protein
MNKNFFISYVYGYDGFYQNTDSAEYIQTYHINEATFSEHEKTLISYFLNESRIGEILRLGCGFLIRVEDE